MPTELFTSGEARWLSVQVEGQREQSRVLLVSVPYALKAADAETVGGKPPSAFVLAAPVASTTNPASTGVNALATLPATTGSGATNFVPLWTSSTNLGNSALFQTGGTGLIGKVGVGTQTPAAKLDVKGGAFIRGVLNLPATGSATTTAGTNSNPISLTASSFKSGTGGGAINQTFRWQAEPVGNNTTAPSGKLNLLFGAGASTPNETGLSISNKGSITVKGPADGTSLLSVRSGTAAGVEKFSVDGFGNITNSGIIVSGNDINTSGFLFSNGLDSTGPATLHNGLGVSGNAIFSGNLIVGALGTSAPLGSFEVRDSLAFPRLRVTDNNLFVYSTATVSLLTTGTTSHICFDNVHGSSAATFSLCSSAAEYVPTIAGQAGYPEAGDLVRVEPDGKNPYKDEHSPFVVSKTSQPCDDGLMGFLLDPKLGAEGTKVNDRYLPLAIYGYFPAKVTMENGHIKRGDPITSSSKPGYGMKATGACKIIGYALEDAKREGTVRVFAHLSENTAPKVAKLQARMSKLHRENITLHKENAALQKQLLDVVSQVRAIRIELAAEHQSPTVVATK